MIFFWTVIGDFALIPLHTTASDAIKEIDKLYDVFEEIKRKWNTEVRHDKTGRTISTTCFCLVIVRWIQLLFYLSCYIIHISNLHQCNATLCPIESDVPWSLQCWLWAHDKAGQGKHQTVLKPWILLVDRGQGGHHCRRPHQLCLWQVGGN